MACEWLRLRKLKRILAVFVFAGNVEDLDGGEATIVITKALVECYCRVFEAEGMEPYGDEGCGSPRQGSCRCKPGDDANEGAKRMASNGSSGVSKKNVMVMMRAAMMAGFITS